MNGIILCPEKESKAGSPASLIPDFVTFRLKALYLLARRWQAAEMLASFRFY